MFGSPSTTSHSSVQFSIARHLKAGLISVAVLVLGMGGWAALSTIAGAVIAQGKLVVTSYVKPVQHPSGGIVGEILARDGDYVTAGSVLLRMDDTRTRINLTIVSQRLDELTARKARLRAERDDLATLEFPQSLLDRQQERGAIQAMASEQRLFLTRRNGRIGQKAQLAERITQLRKEIEGLSAQIDSKDREIGFITKELTGVRKLYQDGLVPVTRLHALERDSARLEGERGSLIASIAQTKGQITEIELKILQVDDDLQREVATELRDIEGQINEYTERKIAAEEELNRIELRSPQDGVVHQLTVHAPGAVIAQGATVMEIVPVSDDLVIEVQIAPQDIDQVYIGQLANLRFSAFNQRTTPEISGTVSRIAADLTEDKRQQAEYYLVRIAVDEQEIDRLGDFHLIPGMPIEAFIQTGERSALSFLLKPLSDQISRAFREE